MSNSISLVIGDIVRWAIALVLLPFILGAIFLFFMYPFEWLLSLSTRWGLILHLLFWIFIGGLLVGITSAVGAGIAFLSVLIVRQSLAYSIVMLIALIGLIGFCLYGAWSSNVTFSWENLNYSILNKILFTFLIVSLISIPARMYKISQEN